MRKTQNLVKIQKSLKKKPCTAVALQSLHPEIDKSVIYRTLQRLSKKEMVVEIILDDGQIAYELKDSKHHHHIICQKCKTIFCIDVPTSLITEVLAIEKKISEKYIVYSHRMDFFVLCQKCQK
ncbi:MAG: hypothetical protein CR972_00255 [Candidatus Moraniibacteriota bacterium]|nr:MAG: hypothetical protein CR972_00255 [Candidatus Moranbacteria bacterium]